MSHAKQGRTIAYGDFTGALGLGAPMGSGAFLGPMERWCEARKLPLLTIIVVSKSSGLPNRPFPRDVIAAQTKSVFQHDWSGVTPPTPDDLHAHVLPRLPPGA